jgi:hypothetical protein
LSSLYILKSLMLCIKRLEKESDPHAQSSFHPVPHPSRPNGTSNGNGLRRPTNNTTPGGGALNGNVGDNSTAGFYPCHYIGAYFHVQTSGMPSDIHRLHGRNKHWRVSFTGTLWFRTGSNMWERLIAIMLSRLRMDVEDTIDEFLNLSGEIFGSPRLFSLRGPLPGPLPKHDHRRLERAIQGVLDRRLPRLRHNIGGQEFRSNEDMCKT